MNKRALVFVFIVLIISGCSYNRLDLIELGVKYDVEDNSILESTTIYMQTERKSLVDGNLVYEFKKSSESLENGKEKWTFISIEGCTVVYITKLDEIGFRRTIEAYISSQKTLCSKDIRYSADML